MAKIFAHRLPNGRAAITRLGPIPDWLRASFLPSAPEANLQLAWELWALAKMRFELTRPKDGQGRIINPNEHFDSDNPDHLARGNALQVTQMDDADLPASRARRDHWVIQGNRVVPSAVDLPPLPRE